MWILVFWTDLIWNAAHNLLLRLLSNRKASWAAWNVDYDGISTMSAECSLMCILHTNMHHPPLRSPASYWLVRRVERKDGLLRDERWSRWIFKIWFSWSAEKLVLIDRHAKQSAMYTHMCTYAILYMLGQWKSACIAGAIKHFHRLAVLIRRMGRWACGVHSVHSGFEAYIALSQATHFSTHVCKM